MKFKLKKSYYSAPTPSSMRKLGDAFLAVGLFIVVGSSFTIDLLKEYFTTIELKWILGGSLVCAILGKFLTNFFAKDGSSTKTDS